MDEVIDWLNHFEIKFQRINGFNIQEVDLIKLIISNEGKTCDKIIIDGKTLVPAEIKTVWYFRWYHGSNFGVPNLSSKFTKRIRHQLVKEYQVISEYFFQLFSEAKWIVNSNVSSLNKLVVLHKAKNIGIKIPESIVTNNKHELVEFRKKHKSLISKSCFEMFKVEYDEHIYSSYTRELTDNDIKCLQNKFFPTLIQKKIRKEIEVRTVVMDQKIFSMAIFSQQNVKTQEDFRNYDYTNPNRCVPFNLPKKLEVKLLELFRCVDLNFGSVDFLVDKLGEFYFLEINPIGQYGMTSKPCNYYLEKKLAALLG